ncbi:beta-ketoacyl synthase N-terminal-like domain-containing protein [Streptomyces sp. NBC_01197]|uniref:beta-ketoacyl synthase N-terminal-like domain-containing protein n=1 Tax=Streptomyces sp. NBC_01197 TaxID=2903768 RepID=UPI002E139EA6|nr:AMP-binding protein [Streptomyces sp. NBC_01197]
MRDRAHLGCDPRAACRLRRCASQGGRRVPAPPPAHGAPAGPRPTGENLAYVIYTSGTTGAPKGVAVPHRAAERVVRPGGYADFGPQETFLQTCPLSFDAHVLEVWGSLANGGHLVLHPDTRVSAESVMEAVRAHAVTALWLTPTVFNQVVDGGLFEGSGLRQVIVGGEVVSTPHLARAMHTTDIRFSNGYGPTEAGVFTCCRVFEASDLVHSPPPVGAPLPGTEVWGVGPDGKELPDGELGELYIGGDALAHGYHDRPDLTEKAFVPHPFGGAPGERVYKSGDLARVLPGGLIQVTGRIDSQVKIRGNRVELTEVESALLEAPEVKQVAVVDRQQGAERVLAAYIVPADGPAPTVAALRGRLARQLPDYMIPSELFRLDRIPLTGNGKADRGALRDNVDGTRLELGVDFRPADTDVESTLSAIWADVLQTRVVGVDDNYFDLGGTSVSIARAHQRIQRELGLRLPSCRCSSTPPCGCWPTRSPTLRCRTVSTPANTGRPDIAVIGMAAVMPGARDIDAFWSLIREGREAVTHGSPRVVEDGDSGRRWVHARGVMDGVKDFDAEFFGIPKREAEVLDPQHRHLLQCAWNAMEDAGHDPYRIAEDVAVYSSVGPNTYYEGRAFGPRSAAERMLIQLSNGPDTLPTRISYKLGLTGESVNVQSACSSAAVAVHLACEALREGRAGMALVGAASIGTAETVGYEHQEGFILSADGSTRAYDSRGSGYVEGVGVLVLRRLVDSQRDGDQIHAVIKGSAVNNDGRAKAGFSAPSVVGQARVIRTALEASGLPAESIGLLEGHGTGTLVGDPIEVRGLTRAYQAFTSKTGYVALGSVKANIGHFCFASGIAGLLKTILCLKHGEILPMAVFDELNPHIELGATPFYINRELKPWKAEIRRAGVSCFGMGGTNAHFVLEQAPEPQPDTGGAASDGPYAVLLSGRTEEALEQVRERLREFLVDRSETGLADLAFTLAAGRRSLACRWAAVVASTAELEQALSVPQAERAAVQEGTAAAIAHEWAAGGNPDWAAQFARRRTCRVSLPTYPWQGERLFTRASCVYRSRFSTVIGLCSQAILDHGTDEQREGLLPKMAAGEHITAFALTEPEAGSDAASLTTTARRVEGGWVIDGSKRYITNAHWADDLVVFARRRRPPRAPDVARRAGAAHLRGLIAGARAQPGAGGDPAGGEGRRTSRHLPRHSRAHLTGIG